MKVKHFWNKAFLAALTRLPAQEAKLEADLATELCIQHWKSHVYDWSEPKEVAWKDLKITDMPPA